MQFIKPENSNLTFGAGDNPDTGDLEVTMSFREDIPGRVSSVSVWEPSEEEFQEFIRTRKLYIAIMGSGMMPISVMMFNPFEHYGFYPGEVVEHESATGHKYKTVNDPRAEMQFLKWMDALKDEVESRDFPGRNKALLGVAPMQAYRNFYDNGMSVKFCANKFQEWVTRGIAQDN